ncbi:MAG: PAS domain-containing protein [Sedimentisphaerales bacterium]|nr:PAS domain-containing protein [Sedimentisphaerales bacterium]
MPLEAKKLGQLLLMQSVLINLPDRKSIFSFVCRGLVDVPGVAGVSSHDCEIPPDRQESGSIYLPVGIGDSNYGVIVLKVSDQELYDSYSEYVKNFVFTLGVVLEERYQRQLNKEHSDLLELRVEERTMQLSKEVKEREIISEVLRESEERYRLSMLAANDGMFDFDIPSQTVTYSDRWFTMLGYKPGELPHHYNTWKSLLHPDDREAVEMCVKDNIKMKKRWQLEFRMKARDDGWRWILARGLCVKVDDKGNPLRVIGTHTDITDRVEAQEKIRQYQDHLETLVLERTRDLKEKNNDLENAMARLQETQSQLILFEKMGALRHLVAGIAHEINNPLGAIESSREVLSDNVKNIISRIPDIARWLNEPQGELLIELLDKSAHLQNAVLDISTREMRQIRQQVEKFLCENDISDSSKIADYLTEMRIHGDLAHFLPVLKMPGFLGKLEVISEIFGVFIASETIKTAVTRAARIVNALNSYIRKDVDRDSGENIRVPIDIRQSLDNVLILFQSVLKSGIELELCFDNDLPVIYGISDELNQVWTNIIQNAIQAMANTGKLTIKAESRDGGLLVSVIDQGCGMTREVQDKIFEPLFTTRPVGEGIGLGMDIVHKIVVDKHSGHIDIQSEVGKGTTVSVFLPVRATD